jgi:hypothetical protein
MRPVILSLTLVAGAVGAIAASQTLGGAGALTINGSLATGGVAKMAAQQNIGITSTGNYSATTFNITGTDSQNRVISERLAGPNNGTATSVLNYLTVTSITSSTALATATTVDTLGIGASREVPVDRYLNPGNVSVAVEVTGTINYTVQWTMDDVYAGAPGPFVWFPGQTNVVNATTTQAASIVSPVSAVRVVTNSGTGTAKLIVQQSGAAS